MPNEAAEEIRRPGSKEPELWVGSAPASCRRREVKDDADRMRDWGVAEERCRPDRGRVEEVPENFQALSRVLKWPNDRLCLKGTLGCGVTSQSMSAEGSLKEASSCDDIEYW